MVQLRRVCRIVNGGTPTSNPENWDGGIPWATPVDLAKVDGGNVGATERTITPGGLSSGSALVDGGALILSTRAPIGYVAAAGVPTAFNQGCKGLEPSSLIDSKYLRFQLQSLTAQLQAQGQGSTFQELSGSALGSVPITLPPRAEQRRIANYLDAETARIDEVIAKKERLISLLQEQLMATVFRLVTAGLDEKAARRASGLEWCEFIPAHWGTPTVSTNFELTLGKMLNPEAADGDEQFPYLRNLNVQWDRLELDDLASMSFDASSRLRLKLLPGDLLVCEGGEVGRAAVWGGEIKDCYFQKAIHRVRSRSTSSTRFLMYSLMAAANIGVFAAQGNQSTIAHLTGEQLSVLRLPWPPDEDQQRIAAVLDKVSETRRRTISLTRTQIALLREHRQALITAAVTGQLDIPGAAA